jgi:hypothetical protein
MSKQTSVLGDPSVSAEMKKTQSQAAGGTVLADVKTDNDPGLKKTAAMSEMDTDVYKGVGPMGALLRNRLKTKKLAPPKTAAAEPGVTDAPSVAPEMKKTQEQANALDKLRAKLSDVTTKKASLDEGFARDLHQLVGLDVPDARDDWQRPDVKVAGQVADRIDDAYVQWMRAHADADVVKEAGVKERIKGFFGKHVQEATKKTLLEKIKGSGKTVGKAGLLAGGAYGAYRLGKHVAGKQHEKNAAVIENDENLDLVARIRRAAQSKCRDA